MLHSNADLEKFRVLDKETSICKSRRSDIMFLSKLLFHKYSSLAASRSNVKSGKASQCLSINFVLKTSFKCPARQ